MSSTSQARKRGLDAPEGDIALIDANGPVESAKRRSRRRGANTANDDTAVAQPNGSNAVVHSLKRSSKISDGQRPFRQLKETNIIAKDFRPKSSSSWAPLGLFRNGRLESKTKRAIQPLPSVGGGSPSVLDESSHNIMHKECNTDDECDDYKYLTDVGHQNSRGRYLRTAALLLSVSNFLALMTLSSVLYTLDFNHKFEVMEKKSMHLV